MEGYFLYYRPVSDPSWSTMRVVGLEATVEALDPATAYQFLVLPIHGEGFVGFGSPTLNESTCGGAYC